MFHKRLDALLKTAVERNLVKDATAEALRELAREQIKERGALTLASVLGWLGGSAVALGVILLIASHWDGIADGVKLAGFFVLMAGVHAAGFGITRTGLPYERTAAALHFVGAGLFLGGVGLVAQVYNLNGRPPNAILLWFVAIAPLAVLLRSASISVMALFALLVWLHMEGSFASSPLKMGDTFATHLMMELGIGAALVGFSGLMKRAEPRIAGVFRGCGALLLFYSIYALGFYRHFGFSHGWYGRQHEGTGLLPWAVLGLGGIGLTLGARHLSPESAWLRNRLIVLLGATLAVAGAILAVETGLISAGPTFETFEFGWSSHHDFAGWSLTVLAWALWFLLALWCIAWGARSDHKGFVNLGVGAVGTGIVTRFFDLMGSLAQTGTLFLIGGLVLLGTAFGMERWRRKIVRQMQAGRAVA